MKKISFLPLLTMVSQLSYAALPSSIPESENLNGLMQGTTEVRSLADIHEKGLVQGETKTQLWSGHYWPYFQGLLGARYRDPQFAKLMKRESSTWKTLHENYKKNPTFTFRGNEDLLSPAEKYDLLVGDHNMSLTKYSWDRGAKTVGPVPKWRGICDGFAAASMEMPRPVKSVKMTSPNGTMITFFPEDIKALGSLLYSRNQGATIFVGKRTNLVSFGSKESNPGTFHKALVNRVGLMGKTFVADVEPGTEVWNYPVKKYEITYYDVLDYDRESTNFQDVVRRFSNTFPQMAKFKNPLGRHPRTRYIVGAVVRVTYSNMRVAPVSTQDGIEYDQELVKKYDYDLELDFNYNILGGESFSKDLPDFIWAPDDVTYPLSEIEENLGTPKDLNQLRSMAKKSSEQGEPLSVIVKKLFEESIK